MMAPDSSRPSEPAVTRKPLLDTGRNRLILAGTVMVSMFALIGLRVIELSVLHESPGKRHIQITENSNAHGSERRDIVDRNGVLLATSLDTLSLSANPRQIDNPGDVARKLAKALPGLDARKIEARLSRNTRFVWIYRHLSPRQQYEVNRLGLPSLAFHREVRRVYPHGPLAAHVVGFTDIDGRGLAGIERHFNEDLSKSGNDLTLSIDIRAQYALRHELQKAMQKFSAIGGAGLIMDANNGEIIAMVSLPDFDPNQSRDVTPDLQFNRTSLGVYEMGSTFKIFTTAMALDSGSVKISQRFDARKPIQINRQRIRDFHAQKRWLQVPEIFVYSSNIGSAKMALAVGIDNHQSFLSRLGMMKRVDIELSEVGYPLSPRRWKSVNTMTIAFGHGIAVSPLHLTAGVAAVTNGGFYRSPTLLRRNSTDPPDGSRVITARTSEHMRRLLRLVVEKGTGKKASVPGYLVGGKTGTAEKQVDGRYNKKSLLSSFVAIFPGHRPRYVVLAMLDEAKGIPETFGYATGGWVAAPVVRAVIERMAPALGVFPEKDPEQARKAMAVTLDGHPLWREKNLAAH